MAFINLENKVLKSNKNVLFYNGKSVEPINFDNGATTPPLIASIKSIKRFMPYYGSVGRGKGFNSFFTTEIFNDSRNEILSFFDVEDRDNYDIIYVKNATEGLNLLANNLVSSEEDIVITTRMEHHSNDLPWRYSKAKVKYVDIDKSGRINLNHLESLLNDHLGKVKIISITGASNVTGYINDIYYISNLAHKYGAKTIVDGAQLVPHKKVFLNKRGKNIDFLVFSAHKIYAPYGIGVIVLKKDYLNHKAPLIKGGGTILYVGDNDEAWAPYHEAHEGGTPNVLGVVGLVGALREINRIGFDVFEEREEKLKIHLINSLRMIKDIKVYTDNDFNNKLAIASFNVNNYYHEEIGDLLSKYRGISVRSGCFCAHPYVRRLLDISEKEAKEFLYNPKKLKPGMVRVSCGFYNTLEEIDELLNTLEIIINIKRKIIY